MMAYEWYLKFPALPTYTSIERRTCDSCHWEFPILLTIPVEGTGETYCFGCYHCWKVGAPKSVEEMEA